MAYLIFFVIVVIAVSGLIAYLGDWIGRRMGKRRLTLFGMRPRHTAIVVTTITGMLIAAVTLGTMLTVSKSMREILVRGAQMKAQIEEYQTRNSQLREKNKSLVQTSAGLSREVREKAAEVAKAREEVEKAQKDVSAALEARNEAQLRASKLQAEIESRLAELTDLRAAGKLTKEQLESISAELAERQEELVEVRADLAQRDQELLEKLIDLDAKNAELAQRQLELKEKEQSIAKAEDQIKRQYDTIQAQNQKLMQASQVRDILLTSSVILPFGRETGRGVINPIQSLAAVKSDLRDLVAAANATEKRLHPDLGIGNRAIELVLLDMENRTILNPKNDEAVIDGAAKAIIEQGRKDPARNVIACLVVVNNTLQGEIAPVVIDLVVNNLAFKQGDTIARKTIDGRMSEGRILLAVNDFLGDDVRSAAAKAGVLPVATPDPEQADVSISGRQLDDLMELVGQIRARNTRIELVATAKKDIYAVGPMNMDNLQFSISETGKAEASR